MAKRTKTEDPGDFLAKLEKYDPLHEQEKREKAAMETFFIGMPARGGEEDQLFVIMNIGTTYETIAQININDVERIIELPNRDHPVAQESIRQAKVIIKPGAPFTVSIYRRATSEGGPRIIRMPRPIDYASELVHARCSCGTCGCYCLRGCHDDQSMYSLMDRTFDNNQWSDKAGNIDD